MKTKQIVGIAVVAMVAVAGIFLYVRSQSDRNGATGDHRMAEEYYTCPMHPSVRSDRPGACPVCGMALVKKSVSAGPEMSPDQLGTISLSPVQQVVANVSTRPVVRGTLDKEITAVGLVSYAEPLQATVAARFSGRIEKLHASFTGERVGKGEPLFELYSPDLLSAQREFVLSLQNVENFSGSAGLTNMEEMQRQLLAAARDRLNVHFGLTEEQIAHLEDTRDVRSSAVFHSPISGTVIEKPVLPGQYVDEGMVLYQLADLSRVWILLDIYEKDLRYVGKGQQVTIASEAYPGEIFEGMVTFIDPVVSPETRTVRVRTEFANPGGKLKPNMFVTARVRHAIRDVLIIPSGAVLSTGERNVVWVQAGEDRFEPREVLLGARNDGSVEVLQGLSEGEMIASTGGFLIDSESSLRMPSGPDSHKGHGPPADGAGAVDGHATDTTEGNGVEDVHIRVKGGYIPEVVHLKRGVRAKLHFLREEASRCTEEVVIRKFGIRAHLPQGEPVRIELTPDETGEFVFSCGMDMVHGKIVVHE